MAEAGGRPYTLIRLITYDESMEGRALPEAIENALRALFCEKNGFNMGVNGRGLGRFAFRPESPQKGRGHLKHDFRLTEGLLPDSTMTYRGRSDGLVVESDRKKMITFKFTFFFFSFSPRQCVAPIALIDKPPLHTHTRSLMHTHRHIHTQTHTRSLMHAHIHTHKHTHSRTHACTHTRAHTLASA